MKIFITAISPTSASRHRIYIIQDVITLSTDGPRAITIIPSTADFVSSIFWMAVISQIPGMEPFLPLP